jgi:hypothetical protein
LKTKPTYVLLLVLALALSLGLIRQPAKAGGGPAADANQTAGLQMSAIAAYNGYFKYGEWLPVRVELQNQGQDLNGEVRVQINNSQGTVVYSAPVALPSGSRKLVTVFVLPNNFSRELEIQLVSQGKTLLSGKVAVRPQPNISLFAGLLSPQRGALSLLSGIKPPGQERPKVLVDLTLEDLSERPEALRSFDLLVFNDTDTSSLTPEQVSALTAWVEQGGLLVIGGGAGARRTLSGLPESLLPTKVSGTAEISTADVKLLGDYIEGNPPLAIGPFVSARADLAPGSQLVAGSKELPLVVRSVRGSGAIYFVSLDLTSVPFNGWPENPTFWETIIGISGRYPENMPFDTSPRQYRANSLYYALSNIPSLDLPSIQGIQILLGIYILIVGPVNYLILRWKRRLHLAWVTIPALTALFTAGSFGIGYTLRGNDLILNKIALVQPGANGDANLTSYMGLFSPRQQGYEVSIKGETLLSPMSANDPNAWAGNGLPATGGEMIFIQDQPARVRGLTVNQWAMQSFMSEGTWKDFGKLSGKLTLKNDVLVGTVRNDTRYTLTDVVLTFQGRFVRLGDMAPGAEKTINLGLSNLQSDRFGTPLSYRLYQQDYPNGPMPRAVEQKSNIVSSILDNTPWMKMISSSSFPMTATAQSGVMMFGWLDQAPPTVEVSGNQLSYRTTALVYTNLDYAYPDTGYITLPPGLIPGSLTHMPAQGGVCGNTTSININQGEAEFEYQLPKNLQALKVNTLKLALMLDSGNQFGIPQIALYKWEKENWTILKDPVQGTNLIQNPAPYINTNGVVRLRVKAESSMMSCLYLDLGMEAQKSGGQQ